MISARRLQTLAFVVVTVSAVSTVAGCRLRYYRSVYTAPPPPAPTYVHPAPVAYATMPAVQEPYVHPSSGVAVATAPGSYGGGVIQLAPGQNLTLPYTDIPLHAIEAVVIQTSDGQTMSLSATDVQGLLASSGGRFSLNIPYGYTSGTVTVVAAGRTWTFPFQVSIR